MADAEARFVIEFDAQTGGVNQQISALERLKTTIKADTAALQELQAAAQRLKGSADVIRFEQAGRDLQKAQQEAARLESKLAALQAKQAANQAKGFSDIGLQQQIKSTESQLGGARGNVARLTGELDKLGQTDAVKALKDIEAAIGSKKASLAEAQTAFGRLGGSMADAADGAKGGASALSNMAEQAGQLSPKLGGIVSKLQSFGKAGGPIAAVVALVVALTAAVIAAGVALARFALMAADAARNAMLLRLGAAGSVAGAKELEASISRVQDATGAAKEQVSGLALELRRAGLQGQGLEASMEAVTLATQVMGQQAGSTIQGLIDRAIPLKRAWLSPLELRGTGLAFADVARSLAKHMGISVGQASAALKDGRVKIEDFTAALQGAAKVRFGDIAKAQALSLTSQFQRAKERLAALFSGINLEPLLGALKQVLDLLSETSATGKFLKILFTGLFQPAINGASKFAPLIKGFILGLTLVAVELTMVFLELALVFKRTFGDSKLLKNVDGMKIAFYAGVIVAGLLIGVLMLLAAVFTILAGTMFLVSLPLILILAAFAAIAAAAIFVATAIDEGLDAALEAFGLADFAGAIGDVIDGIVTGIEDGVGSVVDAFKNLAGKGEDAFKSALGIASPSKVFRAEARWVGAGVAEGLEDSTPAVERAAANVLPVPDREAGGAGRAGRGGPLVLIQTLNVMATKPGDVDRSAWREFVVELFEDAAAEAGASLEPAT